MDCLACLASPLISARFASASVFPVSMAVAAVLMAFRTWVCALIAVSSCLTMLSRAVTSRSCAAASDMSGTVMPAILSLSAWNSVICWSIMPACRLSPADASDAPVPALSSVESMESATA